MVGTITILALAVLSIIAIYRAWQYFILWVAVAGLFIDKYDKIDFFKEAYSKENINEQVRLYFQLKRDSKERRKREVGE